MTNLIDFYRASSEFLVRDRPDVYTKESALRDLQTYVEHLRSVPDRPIGVVYFASYVLIRTMEDEGVEDFTLSRKLATATFFDDGSEPLVVGWTKSSGTLKYGIDLPDILDDDL